MFAYDTLMAAMVIAGLEKWFPLQGERAHSLNFLFVCMYVNRRMRRRGRQNNNYRVINLPKVIYSASSFESN